MLDGIHRAFVLVGSCENVIVIDHAPIEILEAQTVVVMETNDLISLGTVQSLVAIEGSFEAAITAPEGATGFSGP